MSTSENTNETTEAVASALDDTLRDIVNRLEAIESSVWDLRCYISQRDAQASGLLLGPIGGSVMVTPMDPESAE